MIRLRDPLGELETALSTLPMESGVAGYDSRETAGEFFAQCPMAAAEVDGRSSIFAYRGHHGAWEIRRGQFQAFSSPSSSASVFASGGIIVTRALIRARKVRTFRQETVERLEAGSEEVPLREGLAGTALHT